MPNKGEQYVREALKELGCHVHCRGWPDFLAVEEKGLRVFAVEVKSIGEKVTEAQRIVHNVLRRVGIPVHVVYPKDMGRLAELLGRGPAMSLTDPSLDGVTERVTRATGGLRP